MQTSHAHYENETAAFPSLSATSKEQARYHSKAKCLSQLLTEMVRWAAVLLLHLLALLLATVVIVVVYVSVVALLLSQSPSSLL